MADDQKAEVVEEQAQQSTMPVEDQKGQEVANSQDAAQETEETFETPAGDSVDELPRSVSERTREQFEKLKTQLRDAREKLFRRGNPVERVGEPKPLVTPEGLVDVEALTDLQERAYAADRGVKELEFKSQRDYQDRQVKELYEAHPELRSPKTKEAKDLFDESERIWMHSMAYPEKYGGEALSQKQAADLARKRMGDRPETPREEAQRLEAKEQASFGASGQPTQGVSPKVTSEEEQERLRFGTRVGDKDSMVARMRAIRETSETK